MSKNQMGPTHRRYSAEFKERAVRMVRQLREETGGKKGTIGRQVRWTRSVSPARA